MKKSVYSLVLMDEIIEGIDAMAYSMNTSRSNLINQILAEKVAVVTPEMHMQDIFETMEKMLDGYNNFQIQNQASDTMMSIRSVLRYKYNPTIRYAVSLYRGQHKEIGEVKVISRTQSGLLGGYLDQFFRIWAQVENQYERNSWNIEAGSKWVRKLSINDEKTYSPEEIAKSIADYIKILDGGLKIYFTHIDRGQYVINMLTEHYNNYYQYSKIKL